MLSKAQCIIVACAHNDKEKNYEEPQSYRLQYIRWSSPDTNVCMILNLSLVFVCLLQIQIHYWQNKIGKSLRTTEVTFCKHFAVTRPGFRGNLGLQKLQLLLVLV
jgi:hypothetical protein